MLMLLYDFLNLIVSGVKLWTVNEPQPTTKEVEIFALQQLNCVEYKMHHVHCLAERQNCYKLRDNSI